MEFYRVYQFKITLKDIKPPIWRRIQVPETYTFWDLHVAIQDAMGWEDDHLHTFFIKHPLTQREFSLMVKPEDNYMLEDVWWDDFLDEREEKIADWFTLENRVAEYVYDWGDEWRHRIRLEKILPRKEGVKYPICISGKGACPPEDCGGPIGYLHLLAALDDPAHPMHEQAIEILGENFDPEYFDPKEVIFRDPEKV